MKKASEKKKSINSCIRQRIVKCILQLIQLYYLQDTLLFLTLCIAYCKAHAGIYNHLPGVITINLKRLHIQ